LEGGNPSAEYSVQAGKAVKRGGIGGGRGEEGEEELEPFAGARSSSQARKRPFEERSGGTRQKTWKLDWKLK
jgi:hypothetical protein